MATGATSTSTLDNILPTYLGPARYTLQHKGVTQNLIEKITLPDNEGLTYNLPKLGQIVAQSVAEGVDLQNPQIISDTVLQITPAKIGVQVLMTDDAARKTQSGFARKAGKIMGDAMMKLKEQTLVTLFDGFSVSLPGANTAVTHAHISAARTRIQVGGTTTPEPGTGPFRAVLHSNQIHSIITTIQGDIATDSPAMPEGIPADIMREHWVKRVHGVDLFHDDLLEIDANADVKGAVFIPSALLYLSTSLSMKHEDERDASLQSTELNIFDEWGQAEYLDAWGCEMYGDATAPTA